MSTVWTKYIRLMHWIVALVVINNLFILDDGEEIHRYLGYTAAAIVGVRFLYGFKTSSKAHWKFFNITPSAILTFFKNTVKHHDAGYEGHNPLASLTYIVMWILILALATTGFLMGTDQFWGDELIEEIHSYLSNGLMILVAFHLVGIAVDSIVHRRQSWMNMINGKKN